MPSISTSLRRSSQRYITLVPALNDSGSYMYIQESLKNLTQRSFVLVLRKKEKKAERKAAKAEEER